MVQCYVLIVTVVFICSIWGCCQVPVDFFVEQVMVEKCLVEVGFWLFIRVTLFTVL